MAAFSGFLRISPILLFAQTSYALWNNPYDSWYPVANSASFLHLNDALDTTCRLEVTTYRSNMNDDSCRPVVSCLLGAMTNIAQSDQSGAAVILGLTPTIVSTIGMSCAEMALLFTHRPFLSFLLAFGAPSIFPTRPGEYQDPVEVLRMRAGAQKAMLFSGFESRGKALLISLCQYIMVAGAVSNVLQTLVELGTHGIVSFRCNSTLLPLLWGLWPFCIHAIAALSYLFSNTLALSRANHHHQQQQQHEEPNDVIRDVPLSRSGFSNEITPCANHLKPTPITTDEPKTVLALNYLASFLALIHIVFGTLIFSSLLFVSITRAIYIMCRLILSALVCRTVMSFEIAGLRDPHLATRLGDGVETEVIPMKIGMVKGR